MLVQRPSIVPAMTPVVKKALQKRNKYGKIWGLAREATLLAVDDDDSEIVDILQSYIQRKNMKRIQILAILKAIIRKNHLHDQMKWISI